MVGPKRFGWIACGVVLGTAAIEFSIGYCYFVDAEHATMGCHYWALALVTLLGLACLLDRQTHE